MSIVTQVVKALQNVLTHDAEQAARDSGFCRRASKLGGATFSQAMVLGCLGHRMPTLEQLAQTAAACGHAVHPQAFDQRFGPAAADCLQRVLACAVNQVISQQPLASGLLARFPAVYLCDSTLITLPAELQEAWPGTGSRWQHGTQAAMKCQVQLDLCSGRLVALEVVPGKTSDQRAAAQQALLPPGALRLADLGYFNLDVLAQLSHNLVFWLTRWQTDTALFAHGQRVEMLSFLRQQAGHVVDLPVQLGAQHRLPCRLIAVRVPVQVAAKRRARLLRRDKRRGKRTVSASRLGLCAWTIYLTNVPSTTLNASEVLILGRARWQIELLFKLWKADGGLAVCRSGKPYRRLCEILAKLIAAVVQHWALLVSSWTHPDRSLRKAADVVRQQALLIARGLQEPGLLHVALEIIITSVALCGRINRRRKEPHTYQLLQEPSLASVA